MQINVKKLECTMADAQLNSVMLSSLSGLSRNTIEAIKSGRRTNVTTLTAGKLAKALGVKTLDLID